MENFLVLIVLIIFVSYFFAISSGWSELSQKYKTNQTLPNSLLINQEGYFEGGSVIRSLTIGILDEGLYLSIYLFLGLFAEPLLIPWNGISYSEVNDSKYSTKYYILNLGNPPVTSLKIESNIIKKLEEDYGESIFTNKSRKLD